MRTEKADTSFSVSIYLAATHRLAVISMNPNIANCFIFLYGIEVKLATLTQYSVVLCMKD